MPEFKVGDLVVVKHADHARRYVVNNVEVVGAVIYYDISLPSRPDSTSRWPEFSLRLAEVPTVKVNIEPPKLVDGPKFHVDDVVAFMTEGPNPNHKFRVTHATKGGTKYFVTLMPEGETDYAMNGLPVWWAEEGLRLAAFPKMQEMVDSIREEAGLIEERSEPAYKDGTPANEAASFGGAQIAWYPPVDSSLPDLQTVDEPAMVLSGNYVKFADRWVSKTTINFIKPVTLDGKSGTRFIMGMTPYNIWGVTPEELVRFLNGEGGNALGRKDEQ